MVTVEEKDILKGLFYIAYVNLESKNFYMFRAKNNAEAKGIYTYRNINGKYVAMSASVGQFSGKSYYFREPTYEEVKEFEDLEEGIPLKKGKTKVEKEQELSLLIF